MIVGIVGSEGIKFTPETEARAKALIHLLLERPFVDGICSGHCHLGGIDIWAEEIGQSLGLKSYIYPPKTRSWRAGYMPRNIQIAKTSDEVHCITLNTLPPHYDGLRWDRCYHCGTNDHVKSGGCWTMLLARRLGKPGILHVVQEVAQIPLWSS